MALNIYDSSALSVLPSPSSSSSSCTTVSTIPGGRQDGVVVAEEEEFRRLKRFQESILSLLENSGNHLSSCLPSASPSYASRMGGGGNGGSETAGLPPGSSPLPLPPLSDVVVAAEGREIRAHRLMLAATSKYFFKLFCSGNGSSPPPNRIEFQQRWSVVHQLVQCMYGSSLSSSHLPPADLLALLEEAYNLELTCFSPDSVVAQIAVSLTPSNVSSLLHQYEDLSSSAEVCCVVSDFIGSNMSAVLSNESAVLALTALPQKSALMVDILRQACAAATEWASCKTIIKLALDWRRLSSVCDLLRDCRSWDWLALGGKRRECASPLPLSGPLKDGCGNSNSYARNHHPAHLSLFAPVDQEQQLRGVAAEGGRSLVSPAAMQRLSTQWNIANLKAALLSASATTSLSSTGDRRRGNSNELCRVVIGENFHWVIRLEAAQTCSGGSSVSSSEAPFCPGGVGGLLAGCEGRQNGGLPPVTTPSTSTRLRLVYEAVYVKPDDCRNKVSHVEWSSPRDTHCSSSSGPFPSSSSPSRCLHRFPAAQFSWNCLFRGTNVCQERPVFICFPDSVLLHWSTTLPVCLEDLTDEDSLQISVSIVEAPLVSLILYHFSRDLQGTIGSEDIWNRLPHIEYRCLSSYTLMHSTYCGPKNNY